MKESNLKKLETLAEEHGFTHALPYLIANTRQAISCVKAGPADYGTPSASRVGGDPDLPPEVEWPLTTDGEPMTFLVQLNLRELAGQDEAALLPARGMLSFFVGIPEPAYDIEHRVLFIHEDRLAAAVRRIAPEVTALEEVYNGYGLEAMASLEPPNYAYVDEEQIEAENVGYEEYEDLCFALGHREHDEVARLFGYPAGQHDDAEYEAALMLLTGTTYSYHKNEALQQITSHFGGDEEKAKQEIQDTLVLLELDSDDDVGFCWWDAGMLQFFIRREDLLAGRFDRTYCSLYSS
ncbi:YwqG family protein [Paenibacillus filicis]|uniref:YwqG family protein n=1 Tax=Paenibacillus filicis TaxID=669464 RepID=A0ABU9DCR4_9BACL